MRVCLREREREREREDMAVVMGIRLSCAVAGAAFSFVMAHEATRARKEKLWQWVAGKFTFRSSDPAPEPSNPCDAYACRKAVDEVVDAVNGGTLADIHEPTLIPEEVNAVKGDPMAEPDNAVNGERPADLAEPALIPVDMTEIAVEVDPMVGQFHPNSCNAVSVPVSGKFPSRLHADGVNAVNSGRLGRRAANPTGEALAVVVVDAVSLRAAGAQRTVDDVDSAVRVGEARVMGKSCQMDSDERPRYAPDPAPPPRIRGSFLAAAVNAVKRWVRSLLSWVGTAINGVGWDSKVWDQIRRTLLRIAWNIIIELLCRHHKCSDLLVDVMLVY